MSVGAAMPSALLPKSSATVTVLSASATGASLTGVTFERDGLAVGAAVAVVDGVAEAAGGAVGIGHRAEQQAGQLGRAQRHAVGDGVVPSAR